MLGIAFGIFLSISFFIEKSLFSKATACFTLNKDHLYSFEIFYHEELKRNAGRKIT